MKQLFISLFFLISTGYAQSDITSFYEVGAGYALHHNYTAFNKDYWKVQPWTRFDAAAGFAYKNTGLCLSWFYERNPVSIAAEKTNAVEVIETDANWQSFGMFTGIYHLFTSGKASIGVKLQGGPLYVRFPEMKTHTEATGTRVNRTYASSSSLGLAGNTELSFRYQLMQRTYIKLFAIQTMGSTHVDLDYHETITYDNASPDISDKHNSFEKSWTSTVVGLGLGIAF